MGRSKKLPQDHTGKLLNLTNDCRATFWPFGVPGEDRWGGGESPKETKPRLNRHCKSYSVAGRTANSPESWIGD